MKSLGWICAGLLITTASSNGASLNVWADTLPGSVVFQKQKDSADNVEFTNTSLRVETTTGSDFLVLSSFTTSNQGTDRSRQGRWQITTDYTGGPYTYSAISDGTVTGSSVYERWINGLETAGANEYGSINMDGIYHFSSSGAHTFDLYHRTNGGADIETQKASMTVIGLNVAGTTLRHGSVIQDTTVNSGGPSPYYSTVTNSVWTTVKQSSSGNDLAASVDISEYGGKLFLAASWNCDKEGEGTDPVTGEWQLVVYDSNGDVVERLDTTIKRDVINEEKDHGAAMLYATTSDLPKGNYTVKLEQRVLNGNSTNAVSTYNTSLSALALTLQDGDEAGQYFDSFSIGNTDTATNLTTTFQRADTEVGFNSTTNQGLILAANFTTSGSGAQTANLQIDIYEHGESNSLYSSVNTLRTVGSSGGNGAAGIVGYYSSISNNSYDVALNYAHVEDNAEKLYVTDASLVGFSTQSVPEPAVLSFILLTAFSTVLGHRFFHS